MSSLFRRLLGAAALFAVCASTVACGPSYDHTDISPVQGEDVLGGSIDRTQVVVAEGSVLTAYIAAWNDDNKRMGLSIVSKDPSTLEVAPVVNDANFSFIGHKVGNTEIQFVADGDTVLTIAAHVIPQPAP